MHNVIHDGNGTWFSPEALIATTLNDAQLDQLLCGDERVLTSEVVVSDWAFGNTTGCSFQALERLVSLWLPGARVHEGLDGEIEILTGLVLRGGDTSREASAGHEL